MDRLVNLIYESEYSDDEYVPRRPRWIRERFDYFDQYDDNDFSMRFRLSKHSTLYLLTKLEPMLEYTSDRNFSISPMNQLLATLRFYATNSTQMSVGDYTGMSTPTAHRIIHKVTAAIASLHTEFILFPETPSDIRKVQDGFHQIARFPRVVGAMDCTHVRIASVPLHLQVGGEQAEVFRNRKGYFSINVQTIVNANLEITDIVARWPGSAHDSTIFNNCYRKALFDSGKYGNAILVVDGGYAATSYMMPPLENPRLPAEQLYNEAQIRTRNPVERMYGVWKRCFPVLAFGMRIKLEKILNVIIATAVLHNMLRRRGEQVPLDDPQLTLPAPWDELLADGQVSIHDSASQPSQANSARDALICNYFQNLL